MCGSSAACNSVTRAIENLGNHNLIEIQTEAFGWIASAQFPDHRTKHFWSFWKDTGYLPERQKKCLSHARMQDDVYKSNQCLGSVWHSCLSCQQRVSTAFYKSDRQETSMGQLARPWTVAQLHIDRTDLDCFEVARTYHPESIALWNVMKIYEVIMDRIHGMDVELACPVTFYTPWPIFDTPQKMFWTKHIFSKKKRKAQPDVACFNWIRPISEWK